MREPQRDSCPECGGVEVGFRFIKLADGSKEWTGRCDDCRIKWVETPAGPVIEPVRLYPKSALVSERQVRPHRSGYRLAMTTPPNPAPVDPHDPDVPGGPPVPVDHRTGEAKAAKNASEDPPA
jgi:hypothetical protein